MATGVALSPESSAMYDSRPIPPDYARVDVTWTNSDFEEGYSFIGGTLGLRVLWIKSDIGLDMPTPA